MRVPVSVYEEPPTANESTYESNEATTNNVGRLALMLTNGKFKESPKRVPRFNGEEYVVFDETDESPNAQRDFAISDILSNYGANPRVQNAIARLQKNELFLTGKEDEVEAYLKRAGNVVLLTKEDEVGLAKRIEAGLQAYKYVTKNQINPSMCEDVFIDSTIAYQHFYEANLRLVVSIAKKYQGRGLELIDLIDEGNVGLTPSINRFNHTMDRKFSTFATWWIRQNITRAIAEKGRSIRIPVHMYERLQKIDGAIAQYEKTNDGEPTDKYIAEMTEIDLGIVTQLRSDKYKQTVSLDQLVGDDHSISLGEMQPDPRTSNEINRMLEKISSESQIMELMKECGLTRPQKAIISMRYRVYLPELQGKLIEMKNGDYDYDDLANKFIMNGDYDKIATLEEVAVVIGLTRERVRQIEEKALRKLKMRLYATLGDEDKER